MAEEEKDQQNQTEEIKNIVTVEDSGPCKKKVLVEIPEEKIKKSLDEQYEDLRKEAVVPGFRKGRAPLRLLEKRFGSDVSKQVKLKLLADSSEQALTDSKLDKLGEPDIDYENIELPQSGPMKYDFEVEVRPEFELPELEGIEIEKPSVEVTDQQIDEEIMAMRKRTGVWEPKEDGKVQAEDQILADAILKIEDQAEDQKYDNIEIFARKNGFVGAVPVENLDELLIGSKHGDVKKTTVEVPKTYFNEDYRGKKIDIEITVKEVKALIPAELNDAFFNRFRVENEDELREQIADMRKSHAENKAKTEMGDQVYKYLLEKTDFQLPENIVADQSTRILQRQYTNMLIQGVAREQADQQMAQLRASSEEQAKEQLKLFFIMDKIAEKLDISTTEEEINGYIAQAAASRERRPEKMREELIKNGSLAQFSLQVREQKCIEKILEKANIVDVKPGKKKTDKTTAKKAAKKSEKTPEKSNIEKTRKESSEKRAKKAPESKSKTNKKTAKKPDKKEK